MLVAVMFIYLLVAASTGASAREWPVARLLDPSQFHEEVQKSLPVAGEFVVGVALPEWLTEKGDNEIPSLHVFVPKGLTDKYLCAVVRSRRGEYWSSNTYVIPSDAVGGFVQLSYPTRHVELISEFKGDQIAMRATLGQCHEPVDRRHVVAAWRSPVVGEITALQIAVQQSQGRVFARMPASQNEPRPCKRLLEGGQQVFDTICVVDLPDGKLEEVTIRVEEKVLLKYTHEYRNVVVLLSGLRQ